MRINDSIQILNKHFRLKTFRSGQKEIIDNTLNEKDTLVIMPTGGGKSLCYQVPALMFDSVTLVISPLIALMKDQVEALQNLGIAATFINSTLNYAETARRIEKMQRGEYKLVYVAPERFQSEKFRQSIRTVRVSLFAVDEAHCVSQWGHDFRPSYLRLKEVIKELGQPPVIALTATATREVQQDVLVQLNIPEASVFVTGFDRPNLKYFAMELSDEDKRTELVRMQTGIGGSGIVYASTQKAVGEITDFLNSQGIAAVGYHGGMEKDQRDDAQNRWLSGKAPVVVATNAFGMGIDKPDVRYVFHFNMPGSLEAYYQEAGRAGRDGKTAYCILFHNYSDRRIQEFFIENNYPPRTVLQAIYEYLFSLDRTELHLTYREIAAVNGVHEMMVAAAIKLFERYHILQRMNQRVLTYRAVLNSRIPFSEKNLRRAPLQMKLYEWLKNQNNYDISLQETLTQLEISQDQFAQAMRGLQEKELITYTPPFRGRGLKLTSTRVKWDKVPIDFTLYEKHMASQYKKLDEMENYAQQTRCRRRSILSYFGEKYRPKNCKACDVCLNWKPSVMSASKANIPKDTALVLGCVKSLNGQFGVTAFTELLAGKATPRMRKRGFTGNEYFGALGHKGENKVRKFLYFLIREGDLEQSDDEFPVLHVSRQRMQQLSGDNLLAKGVPGGLPGGDSALLEKLREVRRKAAGVSPVFTVFSNRILQEMASRKPLNTRDLMEIPGIGERKVKRYGTEFVDAIREFLKQETNHDSV